MKTFFKIVVWFAAAFTGLFIWNLSPDFRPLITWLIVAAFVCYGMSIIVQMAGEQGFFTDKQKGRYRLEIIDSKGKPPLKEAL